MKLNARSRSIMKLNARRIAKSNVEIKKFNARIMKFNGYIKGQNGDIETM